MDPPSIFPEYHILWMLQKVFFSNYCPLVVADVELLLFLVQMLNDVLSWHKMAVA